MLVNVDVADEFLEHYKGLMTFLNGNNEPEDLADYVQLRSLIFEKLQTEYEQFRVIAGSDFLDSLVLAKFGQFIFLKKYLKGYILCGVDDNTYYQALGLLSPLEELIYDFSIIETSIIPFKGYLLCDGLIQHQGINLGKNMIKEIRDGYWEAKRSGELVVMIKPETCI